MARSDATTKALIAGAVAVWAAATYFALRGPLGGGGTDVEAAPTAIQSAAPSPSSSTTASAAPTGSAGPPPPTEVQPCVLSHFPEGSFNTKKPDVAFVCTEADPLRGSKQLKSQLILASGEGNVTAAIREWAGIGWYQMAGWTLLRARCCVEPPPFTFGFELVCPVKEALDELERAVRARDKAAVATALESYTKQVRCLSKWGQAQNFGMVAPPGADVAPFEKMLGRAGLR